MNGAVGLVPAWHERSLVLEALTLLAQNQTDLEQAVGDQVAYAARRVAAVERRCDEFDARLLSIDEHLRRLVLQLEPPPDADIHERVARLHAYVERLSTRAQRPLVIDAWSPPPAAPNTPAAASNAPAAGASKPVRAEPVRAEEVRVERVRAAPAPTSPASEMREPDRPARPVRAASAMRAPQPSMWELLGPTPRDRAAIILMGIGLVAVVFAVLLQLRLP